MVAADNGVGDVQRVLLRFATEEPGASGGAAPPAAYYGAGEQYTRVNLSGSFVPIMTTEQGVGRDSLPLVMETTAEATTAAFDPAPAPASQQLLWLTDFLNEYGGGAGGNWVTTYTAMPMFVGGRHSAGLFVSPPAAAASTADAYATDAAVAAVSSAPIVSLDFRSAPGVLVVQVLALEWSAWLFWPRPQQNVSALAATVNTSSANASEATTEATVAAAAAAAATAAAATAAAAAESHRGFGGGGAAAAVGGAAPALRSDPTPTLLALESLTSVAGRLPMGPPDWVDSGAIVALEGGTAAVKGNLELLLGWGVPVAAVWIQDWSGRRTDAFGSRLWWNWELDTDLCV